MWIKYETVHGLQYVDSETQENIQAYGNDVRYPEFLKKLESGEIVPILFEETEQYKSYQLAANESLLTRLKGFIGL
jgi:hypothetical protein